MVDPRAEPERRSLTRQRTLLRGRICYGPKHVISVECGIRNITSRGAMLRVPGDQALPPNFTLLHVSEGAALEARLTWRNGEMIGVRFDGRHDLRGSTESEFRSLRAIWAALAAA